MLNSNLEETPVANGSNMTSGSKQNSKLDGNYFSFHLNSRKDCPSKNEENCESIERIRSGEGKRELSSGRSFGFFENIKKKLQIMKLMPNKSKQKNKTAEPINESFRKDESLISVSLEKPIEIRGQIETPEMRSSTNSVNSYIAALMFNGENGASKERVPRFNELVAPQSVSNTESEESQGGNASPNLRVEETSSPVLEFNEGHQNNDLPKRPTENNNDEYHYDVLAADAKSRTTSPVYGDLGKDESEGKNATKATLTEELLKLSKYGWYWGPISGEEADSKLISEPDGAFLVRDSSDDRYLLTLSFKSSGKLLHARMEHSGGLFSLCNHSENHGYKSVADLINHSMSCSQSSVFCYSRPRHPGHPSFPVRLTKPVSRFTQVRSLQYLCRFVIRQNTRLDNIHKLPLPKPIRGYIEEAHY